MTGLACPPPARTARALGALCGMVEGLGLDASRTGVADPAMAGSGAAAGVARVQGPFFGSIMATVDALRVVADVSAAATGRA